MLKVFNILKTKNNSVIIKPQTHENLNKSKIFWEILISI